ncbi:MAG: response regulator transcription factor [Gaiellaceae bacterium]
MKAPGGGGHAVEISSAPLRDGHRIVGVFGVFRTHRPVAPGSGGPAPTPRLTPRQREVLDMLGAGLTTRQMAERTGLSIETIRNHTRGVLRELGAKSRLEAVLVAHRQGLLD